ncbi:MAG TPA: hypothetical protein VMS17_23110 [Gemmataceae bacterium]|nr:hypothetical protein [Gemmataceae bacterium]
MRACWKIVLAGGILLGSLIGLATAPAVANADSMRDAAAALKAGDQCTKYLCQKYYQGYGWCTVYVCYSYDEAMTWYSQQGSGARVVAQK